MASKKSKKPSKPRAPKVTEKTLGERIIEMLGQHNEYLAEVVAALEERNSMLSVVTSVDKHPVLTEVTVPAGTTQDEKGRIILGSGPQVPVSTVAPPTEGEPVKRKRGRPSKAELAARAAAAESGEPAEPTGPALAAAIHEFPQMCPCGVREDVPRHLHAKGCPVHFPAEPVPAHRAQPVVTASETILHSTQPVIEVKTPAPTLDDVRASAIVFVGEHGKERLAALLQQFGAEKLSSVATDKLPALLAAIQAAG